MYALTETDDRTFEWFTGLSTAGSWAVDVDPWVSWSKSQVPGCQFIDVLLIGAGSGGGGGFTKSIGLTGGGGGSGGSGAVARARFPLFFLPDTIYFYLPQGGRGGAANANGLFGDRAAMMARPALANPTVAETFLVSGAGRATGGSAGTTGAGGPPGAAGTVGSLVNCILSSLAMSVVWAAGAAGVVGGDDSGANGTDEGNTTLIVSGGAGGAGAQVAGFNGGNVPARGPFTIVTGEPVVPRQRLASRGSPTASIRSLRWPASAARVADQRTRRE